MDPKYNRYKWADAEIMKKDKQHPLRYETHKIEQKQFKSLTRLFDQIDKL